MNDLREFSATLQVDLGWSKAMGVNPDRISGTEAIRKL
jgi:hypothetical protein